MRFSLSEGVTSWNGDILGRFINNVLEDQFASMQTVPMTIFHVTDHSLWKIVILLNPMRSKKRDYLWDGLRRRIMESSKEGLKRDLEWKIERETWPRTHVSQEALSHVHRRLLALFQFPQKVSAMKFIDLLHVSEDHIALSPERLRNVLPHQLRYIILRR